MHWQTRYPKIKLQLCGLQILCCYSTLIPKQSNTNFGIYQLGNHKKNCLLPRIRLNNHGHLHKGTKYNIIPRKTKQRRTLHLYHSMVLNTRMHVRALFYSYTLIIKEKKRKKVCAFASGSTRFVYKVFDKQNGRDFVVYDDFVFILCQFMIFSMLDRANHAMGTMNNIQ